MVIKKLCVCGGGILLLCAFPFLRLSGQNVEHRPGGGASSFKNRIAIRTNVVDWVLTTPNLAFDYDIISSPYKKQSAGIAFKYNWATSHTYIQKQVYNLFDARADYRFYWRQQPYEDWEREWLEKSKGWDWLRARVNCCRGAENPKSRLSLFVGPSLSLSSYSIKLNPADGTLGRQGLAYGGGLTGGVALPLYGYENGSALDLELGGSLGWHFTSYNLYTADVESNCYHMQGHRNKWVLYPFVTDVRLSLVYRFRSISKQHTEVDYDLIDRREVAYLMEDEKRSVRVYNDSIRLLKESLDKRNEEIAYYKKTVESTPEFNEAYSLEYLSSYVYMLEVPRKYARHDKDTLSKVKVDSFAQITDPILLNARRDIDSIPGMTSEFIDSKFATAYNGEIDFCNGNGKKFNRTKLLKEIFKALNVEINNNNSQLVAGSFSTVPLTEELTKFNVKGQNRRKVTITYKDSVRTVNMTENEEIAWLNDFKRQAWSDVQKRMRGEYVSRAVPIPHEDSTAISAPLAVDSVSADSVGARLSGKELFIKKEDEE